MYIQILRDDKNVKSIFAKVISKSATDTLKNFMDIDSVEKLEFNILLIKLAFIDGLTTQNIFDDTGKNLIKSVFLNSQK